MVKRQINPTASDLDVEDVISKLTINEKVALLSGKDFWHTVPIPRLRIPSIRVSDGPNGIRGTRFFNGVPAGCLPCGTALAATWDKDLVQSGGELMGCEAIAKGVHVILGPTMNIQRSPLGGRGFESYSEDPVLSGSMATAVVKGIQSTGVGATVKHFVCNDQEHERNAVSAIVTERALREIYLMPFMIAQRDAKPKAYMTGYNKLNGVSCSENEKLLQSILREEWKYDGLVMSDWFGTYTCTPSLKAGLDLEMPGPTKVRGEQVLLDLRIRNVTENIIDNRVRALLNLINFCMENGTPENAPEKGNDTPETAKKLRQLGAASQVLLKNDKGALPFKKDKTVAVIGPNAKIATFSGGGSASLLSYYSITPFEGISSQAKHVKYALGAIGYKNLPLISDLCVTRDGNPGLVGKVYNEPRSAPKRMLVDVIYAKSSNVFLVDYYHPKLNEIFYIDWEATLTSEETCEYIFGVMVAGTANLLLDGELIVDNTKNQEPGDFFLGSGTAEKTAKVLLEGGKTYNILVEFGSSMTSPLLAGGGGVPGAGGLRIGATQVIDSDEEIRKAVELAKQVDQVVICAGLNAEWESEGYDRISMSLPGRSDELISAVAVANPRTVVVLQSGTPVATPWASSVAGIIHSWYGGNETGNAIADVLFGDVNPSGKLPLSWPKRVEDNPAFLNFRSELGRVLYGEDVFVGYRFYEKVRREVQWPFGFGLSYTTFTMEDLKVKDPGDVEDEVAITVRVKNTGDVAGAQVVQVYVAPHGASVSRPMKELKGFEKTKVLDAGEEVVVEVRLEKKYAVSWWDETRASWCMEAGRYDVLVGGSSSNSGDMLRDRFEVEKTMWWNGL